MTVTKRQRKEKTRENGTKENLRTGVRTSGETKCSTGQPNLHRAGSGGGEKTYKKDEPRLSLSPLGLAHPHTSRMYYPFLA